MGCHPSHWRSPSFFKMVKLHHQAVIVTLQISQEASTLIQSCPAEITQERYGSRRGLGQHQVDWERSGGALGGNGRAAWIPLRVAAGNSLIFVLRTTPKKVGREDDCWVSIRNRWIKNKLETLKLPWEEWAHGQRVGSINWNLRWREGTTPWTPASGRPPQVGGVTFDDVAIG